MRALLPPRRIDGGSVFRGPDGGTLVLGFREWRKAAKEAGRPALRFHDIRHEWASRYVEAGGDLISLTEVGGWSTPSLVQRYAKASQDRIRLTLEKLANSTPDSTRYSASNEATTR